MVIFQFLDFPSSRDHLYAMIRHKCSRGRNRQLIRLVTNDFPSNIVAAQLARYVRYKKVANIKM